MVARRSVVALFITLALSLSACAPASESPRVLVLLTHFEGRYREVGNDVLYPIRLALADSGVTNIQLRAVDVGDNPVQAVARAAALAQDRTVLAVAAAGPLATHPLVFDALGDIPVVVIGHWNVIPNAEVLVLASAQIAGLLTDTINDVELAAAHPGDVVGGDIYALASFAILRGDLSGVTVISSASLPPADYATRLIASALFVPAPGLHSTLAYDAGGLLVQVLSSAQPIRADVLATLRSTSSDGINGQIQFDAQGYWADAPIHRYHYDPEAHALSVW